MRQLILLLVIGFIAWRAYVAYGPGPSVRIEGGPGDVRIERGEAPAPRRATPAPTPLAAPRASAPANTSAFTCDGRTRCPQMHSCDEATWFLEHCPGVELDGDHDGVPCEQQWCR